MERLKPNREIRTSIFNPVHPVQEKVLTLLSWLGGDSDPADQAYPAPPGQSRLIPRATVVAAGSHGGLRNSNATSPR